MNISNRLADLVYICGHRGRKLDLYSLVLKPKPAGQIRPFLNKEVQNFCQMSVNNSAMEQPKPVTESSKQIG